MHECEKHWKEIEKPYKLCQNNTPIQQIISSASKKYMCILLHWNYAGKAPNICIKNLHPELVSFILHISRGNRTQKLKVHKGYMKQAQKNLYPACMNYSYESSNIFFFISIKEYWAEE